ncbi:hypothetical protein NDU88_000153 [Pleurodeles waltl]|uniref:Uncharacterized protein n=1 Tax=Pleurodeles waltl TaxID=8319 RepID=A0AAV7Q389_PLEWA|nr:hypothetical protein NDU88_000153 [Pleurodeles waltl]
MRQRSTTGPGVPSGSRPALGHATKKYYGSRRALRLSPCDEARDKEVLRAPACLAALALLWDMRQRSTTVPGVPCGSRPALGQPPESPAPL